MISLLTRDDKQEILNKPALKRKALGSLFVYFYRQFSSMLQPKHLTILCWIENSLITGTALHKNEKKKSDSLYFKLPHL